MLSRYRRHIHGLVTSGRSEVKNEISGRSREQLYWSRRHVVDRGGADELPVLILLPFLLSYFSFSVLPFLVLFSPPRVSFDFEVSRRFEGSHVSHITVVGTMGGPRSLNVHTKVQYCRGGRMGLLT